MLFVPDVICPILIIGIKMPSKIKEKLVLSKEKIKEQAKKFKPKLVISKLRHEGPAGARRCAWIILGVLLYILGWSV